MTKTPVSFTDLFRYYKGLPHQMAGLKMLGEQIPASLLHRENEWFKVWSQDGKQVDLTDAIKLIQRFEGCRLEAYPDPASGGEPWTIGWGSTRYSDGRKVAKGDKITQAEADQLLQRAAERIAQQLRAAVPYWTEMADHQQCALVSFAYNLGAGFYGAAGFETISQRLRDKDWARVPEAMLLYRNPGTNVEAGLRRRREAEGSLWLSGKAGTPAMQQPRPTAGPAKRPQDFGFKAGDTHLLVNDISQRAKAFDHSGTLLWEVPCLARGQGADDQWQSTGEDTPPGLYKIGQVYDDWGAYGNNAPRTRTTLAYGWLSFDLIELESQEARYGRAGIMIHGGGTGCGWPGAWAAKQPLLPTFGCVRMHNIDLRDKLRPRTKAGTVFVSVYQER